MKKFLLMFFMIIGIASSAIADNIQKYRTTAFACATVTNGYYRWTDWESSNVTITLNLTTDIITIYSPKTQYYKVYDYTNAYTDDKGGTQIKYYVKDLSDNTYGNIRLRIERNGNSQLYVDFNNVAWVYNVTRIY